MSWIVSAAWHEASRLFWGTPAPTASAGLAQSVTAAVVQESTSAAAEGLVQPVTAAVVQQSTSAGLAQPVTAAVEQESAPAIAQQSTPEKMGFREEVKQASQEVHNRIHKMPFFIALMQGRLEPIHYAQYLVDLRAIHNVLEAEQIKLMGSSLQCLVFPDLFRKEALSKDLETWGAKSLLPSQRAQQYAEALQKEASENPRTLIGAMLCFYGAVLNGGVMLEKCVVAYCNEHRSMLQNEGGAAYYALPGMDITRLREQWRAEFDQLPERHAPKARELLLSSASLGCQKAFSAIHDIVAKLGPTVT
jgi:heme oxygenase